MMAARRGRFVVFEGVDGAGKSLQLRALAARLRRQELKVVTTREPGGTPLGEKLRAVLKTGEADPVAELLMMFAARRQHFCKKIAPALARGYWVLCDRYVDSSFAYQGGGRKLPRTKIAALDRMIHPPRFAPDLVVFLDIPPRTAAKRKSRADDAFEKAGAAFAARVFKEYRHRAAAAPRRFAVVDGAQPARQVSEKIYECVRRKFAL